MTRLPDKKEYIKEHLKGRRFSGSFWVLLGCLALLVWAVGELVTRVDAVDGVLLAYFNLVKNGEITLRTALENLIKTPEAMKDLYGLVYLGGIAVLAFLFSLIHSRRSASAPTILLALLVLFTGPGGTVLSPLLTVTFLVKAGSAALLIVSSVFKIADTYRQKRLLSRKYDRKLEKERASLTGRGKNTYIPERIRKCK